MLMRAANGRLRNRATLFILAALVVGSALGPMLWAISTSLKNEVNAVSAIPSLIPSPATFANYLSVFSHKTFVVELLNSVLYAAGAESVVVRWSALAVVLEGAAGAALIPALGSVGAAISAALAEAAILMPLRKESGEPVKNRALAVVN